MNKKFSVAISLATLLTCTAAVAFTEPGQFSFGNRLVDATEQGNADIVRGLISQGEDPNAVGKFDTTPIHRAAYKGNLEIGKLLIANGADINFRDFGGATPLHIAARQGSSDFVRYLIQRGADTDLQDNEGYTPLHRAVANNQTEISLFLIEAGAELNTQNTEGNSPLIDAVKVANAPIVQELILKGADKGIKNHQGLDVYDYALKSGNRKVDSILSRTTQELRRQRALVGTSVIVLDDNKTIYKDTPAFIDAEIEKQQIAERDAQRFEYQKFADGRDYTNAVKVNTADVQISNLESLNSRDLNELATQDDNMPLSMSSEVKAAMRSAKPRSENVRMAQKYETNIQEITLPKGLSDVEPDNGTIRLPSDVKPINIAAPYKPKEEPKIVVSNKKALPEKVKYENEVAEFLDKEAAQDANDISPASNNEPDVLQKATYDDAGKIDSVTTVPASFKGGYKPVATSTNPIADMPWKEAEAKAEPRVAPAQPQNFHPAPINSGLVTTPVEDIQVVKSIKPAATPNSFNYFNEGSAVRTGAGSAPVSSVAKGSSFDTGRSEKVIENIATDNIAADNSHEDILNENKLNENIPADEFANMPASFRYKHLIRSFDGTSSTDTNISAYEAEVDALMNAYITSEEVIVDKNVKIDKAYEAEVDALFNQLGASEPVAISETGNRAVEASTAPKASYEADSQALPASLTYTKISSLNNFDDYVQEEAKPVNKKARAVKAETHNYSRHSEEAVANVKPSKIAPKKKSGNTEYDVYRANLLENIDQFYNKNETNRRYDISKLESERVHNLDLEPSLYSTPVSEPLPTEISDIKSSDEETYAEIAAEVRRKVEAENEFLKEEIKAPEDKKDEVKEPAKKDPVKKDGVKKEEKPLAVPAVAPASLSIPKTEVEKSNDLPVLTDEKPVEVKAGDPVINEKELDKKLDNIKSDIKLESDKLEAKKKEIKAENEVKSVDDFIAEKAPPVEVMVAPIAAVEVAALDKIASKEPIETKTLDVKSSTADTDLTGNHALVGEFLTTDEAVSYYNDASSRSGLVYGYKVVKAAGSDKFSLAIGKLKNAEEANFICPDFVSEITSCKAIGNNDAFSYDIVDANKVYALIGEFKSEAEARDYFMQKSQQFDNKLEYTVAKAKDSNIYLLSLGPVTDGTEAKALCDNFAESNKLCKISVK